MQLSFQPFNLIIVVLILTPTVLATIWPPVNVPAQSQRPWWWITVIIAEWVGRIGILVLPLFWEIGTGTTALVALAIAILAMVVYYAGWIRFFLNRRAFRFLYEPLLGISLPLAVSPIVGVFFLGIAQSSWPVVAAALVMGLGHIPESIRSYSAIG